MGPDGEHATTNPATLFATRPAAPAASPRPPRRWRVGRLPTLLLVLLLVVTGSLQELASDYARSLVHDRVARESAAVAAPQRVNAAPEHEPRLQAAMPSPSGASPNYPLNHTFDGDPLPLGAPTNSDLKDAGSALATLPTNSGFGTAPANVGGQPANAAFDDPLATGWTAVGTVTRETSGGPSGAFAKLNGTSATLTSTAGIAVDATAQALVVDVGLLSTSGTVGVAVYVLSGATFGTSTLLESISCTGCGAWETRTLNLLPFAGQTVKLRFARTSGAVGIDTALIQVVAAGYAFTSTPKFARELDGGDPFLALRSGSVVSAPFTVEGTAQVVAVRLKGMSATSDAVNVYVRDAASAERAALVSLNVPDAWATYLIPVSPYLGQTVSLRIGPNASTDRIGVDDVGVQRVAFPGWTLTNGSGTGSLGTVRVVAGPDSARAAFLSGAWLTSDPIALPANAQQVTVRGSSQNTTGRFKVELLSGVGFGTVTLLKDTITTPVGQWATTKLSVNPWSGQTVKLRVTPTLGQVAVDDLGPYGQLLPGWTITGTSPVVVGEDVNGTYVAPATATGGFTLESSDVSLPYLGPYDVVPYQVGISTTSASTSLLKVTWKSGGTSYGLSVFVSPSGSPGTYTTGRFLATGQFPRNGRLVVISSSGARIYVLGDNQARQRMSEPHALRTGVGSTVDTSTGAYGTTTTDLTVSGGPMPMVLSRSYVAHSDRQGPLGYRWRHSYLTQLVVDGTGDAGLVWGSGREEFFDWRSTTSTFVPGDARITGKLRKITGAGWTYEYETKEGTILFFEADGDLISFKDANRNTTTVYRNADGTVDSVVDPGGRAIDFAYDAGGRLTSVTGPAGERVQYGYDAATGDLAWVEKLIDGTTTPETETRTEYAYSRHRLTEIRERQGDDPTAAPVPVLTIDLDVYNRVVREEDAEGQETGFAWQALPGGTGAAGVTTVTDALGQERAYYFDAWGRTTHTRTPADEIRQFLFDADGNLTQVIDPLEDDYEIAYLPDRNPETITDPLEGTIEFEWDPAHNTPTKITDPRGTVTYVAYDGDGNMRQTTLDPADADPDLDLDIVQVFTYDHGKLASETVDPAKDWTGASRGSNRLDLMTRYTYDSEGNRASAIVDPSVDVAGTPRGGTHLDLTTSWTYDGSGRVKSETIDPGATPAHLDRTTSYEYDLLGRLREITDPDQQVTERIYDPASRLRAIIDPLDHAAIWTYDENGHVATQKDAGDNVWDVTRDDDDRVTDVLDPAGVITHYTYVDDRVATKTDDYDNPTDPDDELNLVTAYTYWPDGDLHETIVDPNPPGETDHLALTTTLTYDEGGNLKTRTLPDGGVWAYDYDELNNPTTVTDPLGHVTVSTYDRANRLTEEVVDPNPQGQTGHLAITTAYEYDAANRLTRMVDAEGVATTYAYDAGSRLKTEVVDPNPTGQTTHLEITTQYTYDASGAVTSVVDPIGKTTWYEYDAVGRLWRTTEPGTPTQRVTTYGYDAAGHLTSTTAPDGMVTATSYEERGLVDTVTVDTGAAPHQNLVTDYDYDELGRTVAITNPRGKTTSYAYDGGGRVASITDADGEDVRFDYDAGGRQSTVTNARDKQTHYTYTPLGLEETETNPLDDTQSFSYDDAGQIETATDFNGVTVDYTFDAGGRLTHIDPPTGTTGGGITYAYDGLGRQTGMSDGTGSSAWEYDAGGRLITDASPSGTTTYTYDAAGQRDLTTLPGNQTIDEDYDAAGFLVSQTDWASAETTYTYDAAGRLTGEQRPNDVETMYQYDTAGRLDLLETSDGSTLLERWDYVVDANGNRTSIGVSGSTVTNGTEAYAYDNLDRLTSATYADGGSVTYTYDPNGNRKTQTTGGVTTTFTFDDADRLTKVDGVTTYSYDDNGNRLTAAADSFQYDWRDRLIQATVGGTTTDYAYAGDDLRVGRDDGTTATDYAWDRSRSLPVVTQADGTSYVHGPAGVETERDASAASYPLRDGLGSVRARTDDTGAVVGTKDYDAWGYDRGSNGQQGVHGYAGELTDPSTGLVYLRARDYSPGQARFVQADSKQDNPSGTAGWAADSYSYAGNNPTSKIDPSGHISQSAWFKAVLSATLTVGATTGFALHFGLLSVTAEGVLVPLTGMIFPPFAAVLFLALVLLLFTVAFAIWYDWAEQCTRIGACAESFDVDVVGIARWTVEGVASTASTVASAAVDAATDDPCDGIVIDPTSGVAVPVPIPDECNEDCPELTAETKTDRIIRDQLKQESLEGAQREKRGEVVATKVADGSSYDHVTKVSNGQRGLENRIKHIKKELAKNLTDCQRRAYLAELERAESYLNYSKQYYP